MTGDQLSLGDLLKEAGMKKADENADADWKAEADAAILKLAATGEWFTSDDVQALGVSQPANHKAWGSRYQQAAKAGLIWTDGKRVKSSRPSTHSATVTLWKGTPLARVLAEDVAA